MEKGIDGGNATSAPGDQRQQKEYTGTIIDDTCGPTTAKKTNNETKPIIFAATFTYADQLAKWKRR